MAVEAVPARARCSAEVVNLRDEKDFRGARAM